MTFPSNRALSTTALAACALGWLALGSDAARAADKAPKAGQKYFFQMPRAWVEVVKADPDKNILQVRTRKGELRDIVIRPETTLRVRDSYGELSDYYPGEWVMLFICHDAQKNWVFPRAVQDELQMMSSHGWEWTVESLDRAKGLVELSRVEKSKEEGKEGKVVRESFRVSDKTKVWKGEQPSGLDTLAVGDKVLFQTRYDEGEPLRLVVEFFDKGAGLAAVKQAQDIRHRAQLKKAGLPAVVNDLDVLSGSLQITVQPQGAKAAEDIASGASVTVETSADPAGKFTATVAEEKRAKKMHKFQLDAEPTDIVRLRIGDTIRVHLTDSAQPKDSASAPEKATVSAQPKAADSEEAKEAE